jgi:excisionase family DNA binding protein
MQIGTTAPSGEFLLTVKQVAARLGMSVRTVWRRVGSGELPKPVQSGCLSRWPNSEIDAYLESLKHNRTIQS